MLIKRNLPLGLAHIVSYTRPERVIKVSAATEMSIDVQIDNISVVREKGVDLQEMSQKM
jgi:hypothetical protein